jgi:anti-sigma B factor antagonist
MPHPFSLRTEHSGGITVISIEGYLDAHTAPEFEDAIQSEIDSGNVRIIVNCEKLNYISSAGLGVFMGFVEEVREKGGDIKICGLIPKVKQVFEMLAFHEIYDICEDLPGATLKFGKSGAAAEG